MSKFWKKFDDLMGELPNYIDQQIKTGMDFGKSVSTSTVVQNGKKIVVTTINGKTTVKVNGKEYVEKK